MIREFAPSSGRLAYVHVAEQLSLKNIYILIIYTMICPLTCLLVFPLSFRSLISILCYSFSFSFSFSYSSSFPLIHFHFHFSLLFTFLIPFAFFPVFPCLFFFYFRFLFPFNYFIIFFFFNLIAFSRRPLFHLIFFPPNVSTLLLLSISHLLHCFVPCKSVSTQHVQLWH